ncbi:hypothetical protein E4U34_004563 [Claviceps purpurea]|nr:hypothetical protein E4U34_004563 [Claviceps purpurea]
MRASLALLLGAVVSLGRAGLVITPIQDDQIVKKVSNDCLFGEVTPQGCGELRNETALLAVTRPGIFGQRDKRYIGVVCRQITMCHTCRHS